ncbi:MAG: TIR domain-containing protein [Caulobacteraceae bacterium]
MANVPDVFISYCSEDRASARRFAEAFEKSGLEVWWDAALRSGEAYDEAIENALRSAKAVVVLWSRSSAASRWVRAEATLAERHKTLMPAIIQECERPMMFELTHTVDLTHWKGEGDDPAWRAFLAEVERKVEKGRRARSSEPESAEPPANSICVLPLANISGDPEQDFFADGLTEDIITELSRFRRLFVISRNSAFQYKGKSVGARQLARELNVQYVVEGSVRKAGPRVRVTVQLIDGKADRHLWAERFDRQLEDIFELQSEVTSAIVATLSGRVEEATGERAGRKPTENMTAYECLLAGKLLHHRSTRTDNEKALAQLERAIALDPPYAQAHAWKACTLGQAWSNGYRADRETVWAELLAELETALELNSHDSDVHRILAAVHLIGEEPETALFHQERAFELNPNDDLVVVQQGEILTALGRAEEGIAWIRKAMRLNPFHPERFWSHLGRACFAAGQYAEAITALGHIASPILSHYAFLAASAAQLGDAAAARRYAAEVKKRDPDFCVEAFLATLHFSHDEDIAHHRAALLAAGFPEGASAAAPR